MRIDQVNTAPAPSNGHAPKAAGPAFTDTHVSLIPLLAPVNPFAYAADIIGKIEYPNLEAATQAKAMYDWLVWMGKITPEIVTNEPPLIWLFSRCAVDPSVGATIEKTLMQIREIHAAAQARSKAAQP